MHMLMSCGLAFSLREATNQMTSAMAGGLADCGGNSASGTVTELVKAVRDEDAKVHVDLVSCLAQSFRALIHLSCWHQALRIPTISLGNLTSACYPSSEATDKLAQLKEKVSRAVIAVVVHACCVFFSQAKRKGIGNPFPFMPVAEFLPSWAAEARCFLHGCVVMV